ncbi:hypothetical protein CW304_29960 [Bacillus sp. UFRGS-B20]|nr:hypothetical protein CW304_29960 [Bacillus sp. UFRGS-B20]
MHFHFSCVLLYFSLIVIREHSKFYIFLSIPSFNFWERCLISFTATALFLCVFGSGKTIDFILQTSFY